MAIATTGKDVLAKFFDEGAYSALYADEGAHNLRADFYR